MRRRGALLITALVVVGALGWANRHRRSPEYRALLQVLPGNTRQVVLATSADGRSFQVDPGSALPHADVPDLVKLGERVLLYAMDTRRDQLTVGEVGSADRRVLDLGPLCDPDQGGHCVDPAALALPGGGLRLYFTAAEGLGDPAAHGAITRICSATSQDGQVFTVDPGSRLEGEGLVDPDPVLLRDGSVRLYVSQLQEPDAVVRSALSPDGLRFSWEPGLRLHGSSATRTVALPGGGFVHLFHDIHGRLRRARSSDGLSLRPEHDPVLPLDLDPERRLLGTEAPALVDTGEGWVMAVGTTREPLWPLNALLAWGGRRDAARAGLLPPH